ncbi:uncharacterized protein TNCV_3760781 [Trichonephila clavipes]|nr:uncharacterized protein TNCV_3760781 [Trichonephila clavipes]
MKVSTSPYANCLLKQFQAHTIKPPHLFCDPSRKNIGFFRVSLSRSTKTRLGINKVDLHMYKASSHTSKSTATYLANKESETGIKCIPLDEMRVKLPYASLMDFCAFGLLKRELGEWHPSTLSLVNGSRGID